MDALMSEFSLDVVLLIALMGVMLVVCLRVFARAVLALADDDEFA